MPTSSIAERAHPRWSDLPSCAEIPITLIRSPRHMALVLELSRHDWLYLSGGRFIRRSCAVQLPRQKSRCIAFDRENDAVNLPIANELRSWISKSSRVRSGIRNGNVH